MAGQIYLVRGPEIPAAGGNFWSAGGNLCPRAEIYARGQKMTNITEMLKVTQSIFLDLTSPIQHVYTVKQTTPYLGVGTR